MSSNATFDRPHPEPAGTAPEFVHVVEVGPRDGLQNEATPIPTADKIMFVNDLTAAGLPTVEVTSFVNPAAVPQLADAGDVLAGINQMPDVRYLVLVPNDRGLDRAIQAGATSIAVFAAATEGFSRANLRASMDDAFVRFEAVARRAIELGIYVRGYVSVALTCPSMDLSNLRLQLTSLSACSTLVAVMSPSRTRLGPPSLGKSKHFSPAP